MWLTSSGRPVWRQQAENAAVRRQQAGDTAMRTSLRPPVAGLWEWGRLGAGRGQLAASWRKGREQKRRQRKGGVCAGMCDADPGSTQRCNSCAATHAPLHSGQAACDPPPPTNSRQVSQPAAAGGAHRGTRGKLTGSTSCRNRHGSSRGRRQRCLWEPAWQCMAGRAPHGLVGQRGDSGGKATAPWGWGRIERSVRWVQRLS